MNHTSPAIWSETVTIRSYDVDFRRQATVEALCRYFFEAAWNHAEALGFGFSHLAREGKLWVLSRLLLNFEDFPGWGDKLTLKTWPRPAQSVFALRDFEIFEAAGQRIAAGSSAWLVLEAQSRRPQRVEKFLAPIAGVSRQAAERDPAKLPAPSRADPQPRTTESAAIPAEIRLPAPDWPVRYSDVDLNGHANSARYIGWLMDSYPADWHQRHAPQRLELNYLGESRLGETLSLRRQQISPQEFLHSIVKADRREACRARIQWRSPPG